MKHDDNLIDININEAANIEGGWIQVVTATCTIFGGVCLIAYGAGYIYGKIKCGDASKVTGSIGNLTYSRMSTI